MSDPHNPTAAAAAVLSPAIPEVPELSPDAGSRGVYLPLPPGAFAHAPLLQTLLSDAPVGFAVFDAGLRFRYVNDALAAVSGRPAADHLGRPLGTMLPTLARTVEPLLENVLRSRRPLLDVEITGETPTAPGQTRHWTASYYPVEIPSGGGGEAPAVPGVGVVVSDVTERKRAEAERREAEEALRRSEARFRRLAESNLIGVAFGKPGPVISDANDAFLEMLGYTREDLRAGGVRWPDINLAEHAETTRRALEEARERGSSAPFEKEYLHKDGRRVPVLVGIARLEDSEDDTVSLVLDLTWRKRDEHERERLLADLRESETRFRAIFDNSVDAIAVSRGAVLFYCNPAYGALFGAERPEDLIGTYAFDRIAPEERAVVEARNRRREAGRNEPAAYETRGLRMDGTRFDMELHAATYEQGGERYTVAILRDVTARKEADAARAAAEARLHTILANVPAVVFALDADGVFTFSEGRALRGMGFSSGEVVGRSVFEVYHDLPELTAQVRRALAGEDVEWLIEAGDEAWEARCTPLRDREGRVTGATGVTFDVSARRRAERALGESERRFREMLETVQLATVILDRDGRITFCNDFLLRLLGYDREGLLGRDWFDTVVPPDRSALTRRSFRDHLARGAVWPHGENEVLTRRGARRLISWNNTLLHDANGAVVGATSIGEDVTVRRELEEKIRSDYERDHRIAEALQRSMLLTKPEDLFPGLRTEQLYVPASDEALVGGDFFDAFALPENRVALVVGDASGKGLAAAARTAEVKYALRAYLREHPHSASALARLNDFVCESRRLDERGNDAFVALSLAVVDPATGEATFSAAGAEPPLLLRRGSRGRVAAEVIDAGGLPLGVEPGEGYSAVTLTLAAGDTIVMTTDGITEARRGSRLLGYEGMTGLARRNYHGATTLLDLGTAILEGAKEWAGGILQDDACLLLARRD